MVPWLSKYRCTMQGMQEEKAKKSLIPKCQSLAIEVPWLLKYRRKNVRTVCLIYRVHIAKQVSLWLLDTVRCRKARVWCQKRRRENIWIHSFYRTRPCLDCCFYSHLIPKKRQKRTTFLCAVSRSVALPHLYASPPPPLSLSLSLRAVRP